jgi:hypothetical protein
MLYSFSLSFYDYRQPFRARFRPVDHFEVFADEPQDPIETVSEEGLLHVLRAASEVEINLYAVTFLEPLRGLFCLELQIMVSGSDLNLYGLKLYCVSVGLDFLLLLILFVLKFTIVCDFCNWRYGYGRNLDEVESGGFGPVQGFGQRNDAVVLAFCADDAKLSRPDLMIDAQSGSIVLFQRIRKVSC